MFMRLYGYSERATVDYYGVISLPPRGCLLSMSMFAHGLQPYRYKFKPPCGASTLNGPEDKILEQLEIHDSVVKENGQVIHPKYYWPAKVGCCDCALHVR